jgi:hypothetical protein
LAIAAFKLHGLRGVLTSAETHAVRFRSAVEGLEP